MKIKEWIKIFSKYKSDKSEKSYSITLNNNILDKAIVYSHPNHNKTMKLLRAFKTVQYDNIYVLRNKKGFNTIGFGLNYDVVIADKDGKVIKTLMDLKIDYISKYYENGYFIYFMPVGSINFYKIGTSDILRLQRDWFYK